MTAQPLDLFCQQNPGCELAVLADVSTDTVLASHGVVKWPQEQVDALIALADALLSIGQTGPDNSTPQRDSAVLARDTGMHVVLRAGSGSSEIFCGVFAPDTDMEGVFEAAETLCQSVFALDADGSDGSHNRQAPDG